MKRNEIIANSVWLLIAALLIVIANVVPQFNGAPGVVFAALGIGIIFYRFWRQRSQKPGERRLILGRFSSRQLRAAAGVLLVVNFFLIMFIAKIVENASRQTIFIVVVGSVVALSAPVGVLFGASVYNALKRD